MADRSPPSTRPERRILYSRQSQSDSTLLPMTIADWALKHDFGRAYTVAHGSGRAGPVVLRISSGKV